MIGLQAGDAVRDVIIGLEANGFTDSDVIISLQTKMAFLQALQLFCYDSCVNVAAVELCCMGLYHDSWTPVRSQGSSESCLRFRVLQERSGKIQINELRIK